MVPFRHIALHAAIGFAAATVFVTALLLADPGGIGLLLQPRRAGPMPLALLWLFSGMTFSVAQFATSLGTLPGERDRRRGSLSASPWATLRPARMPAMARAARRPRTPSR